MTTKKQFLWSVLLFLISLGSHGQTTLKLSDDVHYLGNTSTDGQVESFLGIPFAMSPVGDLRWRIPEPLNLKSGTYSAQHFPKACMQGSHIVNWYRNVVEGFGGDPDVVTSPDFSEDCLYLNIWRPTKRGNAPLPVAVFIHGGSNKGGWSYEPNYIGENLAREDLIVVTIAYRLGIFGFFSHPDLDISNFGLLDQIAALRWIKTNIAAAGGNPDNVTVFGESAGASNIEYLMISPLAKGLFQRAIHQSGGWPIYDRNTPDMTLARSQKLAELLGSAEAPASLEAMRENTADELMASADEAYAGHFFDPVIDGHGVTTSVSEALATQAFPPIDLIIGSNRDEWRIYLAEDQTVDKWLAETYPNYQINAAEKDTLMDILDEDKVMPRQLDRLISAHGYVCPSMILADAVRSRGGKSWFYYFTRQREGEQAATMGAYHGAELPYVFNTHDDWLPTHDNDYVLTGTVVEYWTNFIRTGDPNVEKVPNWPPFKMREATTQVLDTQVSSVVHSSLPLCDLLNTFAQKNTPNGT
ncbi:MAG: carboxylesterase family protein [Pseudomonadota bacterium]